MGTPRRTRVVIVITACLATYFFLPLILLPSADDHNSPSGYRQNLNLDRPAPPRPITYQVDGVPFRKSSKDWSTAHRFWPVSTHKVPPSGPVQSFPQVQYAFPEHGSPEDVSSGHAKARPVNERRQTAVRNMFKRDWNMYRRGAWGHDELDPVTGQPKDPFCGWAATMVDAMDTLWIMGLEGEFEEAVRAAALLDWGETKDSSLNVFETTIRHLGGLLSAYTLSGNRALLAKAEELGDLLYMAFDTPNQMPPFWLVFRDATLGKQRPGIVDSSAAIGTLSMEFSELSRLTGNAKYYDAIDRVRAFFESTQNSTMLPGMWPLNIDVLHMKAQSNTFTLGGGADSLYEYLPKMDILLGGRDESWRKMATYALDTAMATLVFRPMTDSGVDVLFSGGATVDGKSLEVFHSAETEHLTCFVGGMYMMSGKLYSRPDYLNVGKRLADGCAWAYHQFPSGVMPESATLLSCPPGNSPTFPACAYDETQRSSTRKMPDGFLHMTDSRYIMRPEAIESIFYAYRITGDESYRDTAWEMWVSIERLTSVDFGHSGVRDISATPGNPEGYLGSMESFWFAETLKYFYLIFSDPGLISLEEYVLNTEAHPFRRPQADDVPKAAPMAGE